MTTHSSYDIHRLLNPFLTLPLLDTAPSLPLLYTTRALSPTPPHHTLFLPPGVLHACEIADINCLKVANESTLIALSYGIFKSAAKLFSETEAAHTMFIDVGYTVRYYTMRQFALVLGC